MRRVTNHQQAGPKRMSEACDRCTNRSRTDRGRVTSSFGDFANRQGDYLSATNITLPAYWYYVPKLPAKLTGAALPFRHCGSPISRSSKWDVHCPSLSLRRNSQPHGKTVGPGNTNYGNGPIRNSCTSVFQTPVRGRSNPLGFLDRFDYRSIKEEQGRK